MIVDKGDKLGQCMVDLGFKVRCGIAVWSDIAFKPFSPGFKSPLCTGTLTVLRSTIVLYSVVLASDRTYSK